MNWQPIETAPKDNSLVLVWAELADRLCPIDPASVIYGEGGMAIIIFTGTDSFFIDDNGNEYDKYGCPLENDFAPAYSQLTHWMPLPEPPK